MVYLFTLLFVAVAETVFWDECAVRFNFIALDYLVFTNEVIGNIRESYPVGRIIAALMALSLLLAWGLRRSLRQQVVTEMPRAPQFVWVASLAGLAGMLAWGQTPPEFSANSYANELADNGWRSFIWAARQNKLDYRQFYALRPDDEVVSDLRRLSVLEGVFSDADGKGMHPRINHKRIEELEHNIPQADADAFYAKELTIDLSTVEPIVSGPNTVKTYAAVSELKEKTIAINKAYLVSCVNSRVDDIAEATAVIKGKES